VYSDAGRQNVEIKLVHIGMSKSKLFTQNVEIHIFNILDFYGLAANAFVEMQKLEVDKKYFANFRTVMSLPPNWFLIPQF
jgi:predicted DNA-binding protein